MTPQYLCGLSSLYLLIFFQQHLTPVTWNDRMLDRNIMLLVEDSSVLLAIGEMSLYKWGWCVCGRMRIGQNILSLPVYDKL